MHGPHRILTALAAATTLLALQSPAARATEAARPAPAASSDPVFAAKALATPNLPGVNDWFCKPSAAHPRPVVLVHGTISTGSVWAKQAPAYKAAGYCVFALDYGRNDSILSLWTGGVGPIAKSAKQLKTFVDGVLAATGTEQVDIVGFSQGGVMPRQYMKFEDGAPKVHRLVGIAPTNHGTLSSSLLDGLLGEQPQLRSFLDWVLKLVGVGDILGVPCPACGDQIAGSAFLKRLNEGSETQPGVSYTVLATKVDNILNNYRDAFLKGPDVDNITIQDACPHHATPHSELAADPVVTRLALNALDPAHTEPPRCAAALKQRALTRSTARHA
ncbi:esterase/lipase family protein [Streptomyces sp. NPDC059009]|uniref:esterase/lipase family protein n=1 Tax=Streptomyces sp. NPDC059009 TaxID=3346694 RepID=UPI0036809FC1